MKHICCILIILFSVCGFAQAGKDLEFIIACDKDKYTTKESISMNFTLKNKGKSDIFVNKRFYLNSETALQDARDMYLIVTAPEGAKLEYTRPSDDTGFPRTGDFALLKPGEEASIDRKRAISNNFDFKKPGKYKIMGVYHNKFGREIGIDACTDKIESNPLTIEIIE
ncbi:MAG: hypothetical protein V2A72_05360 [Candidatus Omnitrophota bacterium]